VSRPLIARLLALVALPLALSAQTNLVTNGNFEATTVTQGTHDVFGPAKPWFPVPTAFGWSITGHSVDVHCWTCAGWVWTPDGNQTLELNGDSTGGIWQTLSTTAGERYALSFLANAYRDFRFAVRWGGATLYSGMVRAAPMAVATGQGDWYQFTFSNLLATSSSTNLEFVSLVASGNSGVVLDAVSVLAAPEPTSAALLGSGLGALLIAHRRRRRVASPACAASSSESPARPSR
jgi:hypothetical protein